MSTLRTSPTPGATMDDPTGRAGVGAPNLLPARAQNAGRAARGPLLERVGRAIVARALRAMPGTPIEVIDAGDAAAAAGVPTGRVRIVVHDPAFYRAVAFGGELGVAESYIAGWWTCDDLPRLVEVATAHVTALDTLESPLTRLLAPLSRLAYTLERNTRAGSKRNIVAHYDLGNDFFALFLDPGMVYSSAIFPRADSTLEEGQFEKIDRACRRLDLRPSDHLLEIGSGWGALAIHAAKEYGCRVTTTTISDAQHAEATRRVSAAGLAGRVTVLRRDYRDLDGAYDKLVSIEMIEAVGREHLPGYFATCDRLLKPDGAALIQAIVIRDQFFERAARTRDFLKKYIFPGSCLPSLAAMHEASRDASGLRLWHCEDFAGDYARTLALWRARFFARERDVRAMGYDDRFVRMWDYYLAYCEGAFRARHVGVVQALYLKPGRRARPGSAAPEVDDRSARA